MVACHDVIPVPLVESATVNYPHILFFQPPAAPLPTVRDSAPDPHYGYFFSLSSTIHSCPIVAHGEPLIQRLRIDFLRSSVAFHHIQDTVQGHAIFGIFFSCQSVVVSDLRGPHRRALSFFVNIKPSDSFWRSPTRIKLTPLMECGW